MEVVITRHSISRYKQNKHTYFNLPLTEFLNFHEYPEKNMKLESKSVTKSTHVKSFRIIKRVKRILKCNTTNNFNRHSTKELIHFNNLTTFCEYF